MSGRRIGITLGDAGGVGPEVVARALAGRAALPEAEYVIYGDEAAFRAEAERLGLPSDGPSVAFRDPGGPRPSGRRGAPDGRNGAASFRAFEAAVAAARAGELEAIATAPVAKASWDLAGLPWRGHTDYLASFFPGAIMTFWSETLTVALLSHHIPLREALARVTKADILAFLRALASGLDAAGAGPYELLMAGLNPHAGEGGLLGGEEAEEIAPAVREAREGGLPVSGPFPPDVVFRSAYGRPGRIVVALYHDQGLIPFKLAGFETGVNVTLGMPFLRTSPDHGTAFDIAGQGRADARSMIAALRLAARPALRAETA
jgi:4-hydroxythreonine-4-phosphate dehydrogenase